jgi:hypothetical protein
MRRLQHTISSKMLDHDAERTWECFFERDKDPAKFVSRNDWVGPEAVLELGRESAAFWPPGLQPAATLPVPVRWATQAS